MTIDIDEALAARIESIATRRGITVAQVVDESLRAWLRGADLADHLVALVKGLGAADTVPQLVPIQGDNVIPFRRE